MFKASKSLDATSRIKKENQPAAKQLSFVDDLICL
jgi:hypothetical protein